MGTLFYILGARRGYVCDVLGTCRGYVCDVVGTRRGYMSWAQVVGTYVTSWYTSWVHVVGTYVISWADVVDDNSYTVAVVLNSGLYAYLAQHTQIIVIV